MFNGKNLDFNDESRVDDTQINFSKIQIDLALIKERTLFLYNRDKKC